MVFWYGINGEPIDMFAAEKLLRDLPARQLRETKLVTERGVVSVSTIFLVLDHNHTGEGLPVLWETMVFGGPIDMHQWRYQSREGANAGHDQAVSWARSALNAEGVAVMADETVSGRA